MGDDALLLAEIATLLAKRSAYLPILNGPRLQRLDADHEVIRRHNAMALVQPQSIIFAGLPDATSNLFTPLPRRITIRRIHSADDLVEAGIANRRVEGPLYWGRTHIGVGVLQALRSRRRISFADMAAPATAVDMAASHIVVCEDGDLHSQVIAATFALSIDAGLCIIPEYPEKEAEELLEALYGVSEGPAPTTRIEYLRGLLRAHVGALDLRRKTVTFVTAKLPWGFAFPDLPSTHLFRYPDLGIAIVRGIATEQEDAPGIRSAVVIAPHSAESADARTALARLTDMGVLSKALRGSVATVYQAAKTITLWPYDLLLIATHCTDAQGYRCTYEFTDTDGRARQLVLDEAAGAEIEHSGADHVHVTVFQTFVSLDGVDWSDQEAKAALPVGAAITTYLARRADDGIEPARREPVDRVRASMALRMADGNYIALPSALASSGTPIVVSNACGSWHRLAETFTFSGARCYIGTLFSVLDPEAEEVARRLFDRHLGMELASALARAQTSVYGNSPRHPYVMVGCHFQRIRKNTREDSFAYVRRQLQTELNQCRTELKKTESSGDSVRSFRAIVNFLESELQALDDAKRKHAFRS